MMSAPICAAARTPAYPLSKVLPPALELTPIIFTDHPTEATPISLLVTDETHPETIVPCPLEVLLRSGSLSL